MCNHALTLFAYRSSLTAHSSPPPMESEFISWLSSKVAPHSRAPLGFGDDAAVLRLESAGCVVTTDMLTDGVDFHVGQVEPRRIGHKALAVSLSDLAAMAAKPLAAFVSLALPRGDAGLELAQGLYEGILELAAAYDVTLAGGDTNTWDGGLVIATTLLGEAHAQGALTRGGAQPGDWIVVTGAFGGSILGRHLDVQPRVKEILRLRELYTLHAGIDVSDGLALDLSRVARESTCGAIVDLTSVPIHDDALRLADERSGSGSALDHALGDGEDFELILAVPPDDAVRMIADQPLAIPLNRIGQFVEEPGLWQTVSPAGKRPLSPTGFEH